MKKCTKCGKHKPLDAYYADRRNKDGRVSECKDCFAARSRGVYEKRKNQYVERSMKWRADNRERYLQGVRRQTVRQVSSLSDKYVVACLRQCGINVRQIPSALMEVKREQLRLHRLAKEMQQAAAKEKA